MVNQPVNPEHINPNSACPVDCVNPDTADDRARTILATLIDTAAGSEIKVSVVELAQQMLRYFLMAAAITGSNFSDIRSWIRNPDSPGFVAVLTSRPDPVPAQWVKNVSTILNLPELVSKAVLATVDIALARSGYPAHPAGLKP